MKCSRKKRDKVLEKETEGMQKGRNAKGENQKRKSLGE